MTAPADLVPALEALLAEASRAYDMTRGYDAAVADDGRVDRSRRRLAALAPVLARCALALAWHREADGIGDHHYEECPADEETRDSDLPSGPCVCGAAALAAVAEALSEARP